MILSFFWFLNRALFTCADSSAARGDDVRQWQLHDLFSIQYNPKRHDVGPCHFEPLYIVRLGGKIAPKTGRVECQAMARAKMPLVCPIGSLAMYLYANQYLGARMQPPNVLNGKRAW